MGFYENFLRLCNSEGKRPSKVILDIGGAKSAVTRWKAGSLPTDATAQKIADYFGVSVSDLMEDNALYLIAKDNGLDAGADVLAEAQAKMAIKKAATENGDGLDRELEKLVDQLTPEERTQALSFLKFLLDSRGK